MTAPVPNVCGYCRTEIAGDMDAMREHIRRAHNGTGKPIKAACPYCDGTGDVHRSDGEWLGKCDCREHPEDTFAEIHRAVRGEL